MVWVQWCSEDLEEKGQSMNQLVTEALSDWSGNRQIEIRQLAYWSGGCPIKIRRLPVWSGGCKIKIRCCLINDWSGGCQIKFRQLPDWSGSRFVRSLGGGSHGCCRVVTGMIQRCYIVVVHNCYRGVTGVFKGCDMWCYTSVTGLLQDCWTDVTNV